ncbi:unnamed protein product [Urochloa decumbens]|uniref:F-box domain-containing protein n=1 Tax=Urochloa decumbens TaxID=240449 RepID=A0ABC8VWE9_9POAL
MAPAAVLTEPPLPDEVMEDTFLRLDDAADLARASAACTSFRRVVRGRRFRSLHPPPVLCLGGLNRSAADGYFHFRPVEPPHRSASAARALVQAADFTLSFLPDPKSWFVRDARDGRVLLSRHIITRVITAADRDITDTLGDLMVADPLHCRYVQIPSIPGDLVPTRRHYEDEMKFEPFLAPACEDDEDLSFRVIYNVMSQYKVVTFVFSLVTEEWRHATSISFLPHRLIHNPTKLMRYCVRSCFCWAHRDDPRTYMLVLDPLEMKFSVAALLLDKPVARERLAIVDAGEDKLGVLTFSYYYRMLDLYCKTWRNNVVCTEDWQYDKTIPLPEHNSSWKISGAGAPEGYLLMRAYPRFEQQPKQWYFTLDTKTLLFERMYESGQDVDFDLLYASFPPPLSPPSI